MILFKSTLMVVETVCIAFTSVWWLPLALTTACLSPGPALSSCWSVFGELIVGCFSHGPSSYSSASSRDRQASTECRRRTILCSRALISSAPASVPRPGWLARRSASVRSALRK